MTYRIVVADDHPLMRQALCSVLEDEPDFAVVAQAGNGEEAVAQTRRHLPDVVVMDLLMPVKDGVQAIREINTENPSVRILALSSNSEESRVLDAIQSGALGYLSKDAQPLEILNAIRLVAQGEFYLQRDMTFKLLQGVGKKSPPMSVEAAAERPTRPMLTAREDEILSLMSRGMSNRAIAQALVLSEATVRSHIYHILNKLGLEDRNQAVVYAIRQKG